MNTGPIPDGIDDAPITPQQHGYLHTACAHAGLSVKGARLLHHYANTVWLLPAEQMVARVSTSRLAHQKARTSLAVCQWLIEQHQFPVPAPASDGAIEPAPGTAVTFWTYYPQPAEEPPDSTYLGQLLHRLHALPRPTAKLPRWRPLTSLELTIRDMKPPFPISDTDRCWLINRIEQIRQDLQQLEWPLGYGLIHGDAWAGNLLWNTSSTTPTALLGDWDSTSYGPREIDLIATWHAAIRFGRGPQWSAAFADAYGYDLSGWAGLPTALAMRDLVQLVGLLRRVPRQPTLAPALHQRLTAIKNHDTRSTWTPSEASAGYSR